MTTSAPGARTSGTPQFPKWFPSSSSRESDSSDSSAATSGSSVGAMMRFLVTSSEDTGMRARPSAATTRARPSPCSPQRRRASVRSPGMFVSASSRPASARSVPSGNPAARKRSAHRVIEEGGDWGRENPRARNPTGGSVHAPSSVSAVMRDWRRSIASNASTVFATASSGSGNEGSHSAREGGRGHDGENWNRAPWIPRPRHSPRPRRRTDELQRHEAVRVLRCVQRHCVKSRQRSACACRATEGGSVVQPFDGPKSLSLASRHPTRAHPHAPPRPVPASPHNDPRLPSGQRLSSPRTVHAQLRERREGGEQRPEREHRPRRDAHRAEVPREHALARRARDRGKAQRVARAEEVRNEAQRRLRERVHQASKSATPLFFAASARVTSSAAAHFKSPAAAMSAPVLVLNQNTKRETGRQAQIANITAAKVRPRAPAACAPPPARRRARSPRPSAARQTAAGRQLNDTRPCARRVRGGPCGPRSGKRTSVCMRGAPLLALRRPWRT